MHLSFWCVGGRGGWREDKQQTVKNIHTLEGDNICDEEKKKLNKFTTYLLSKFTTYSGPGTPVKGGWWGGWMQVAICRWPTGT